MEAKNIYQKIAQLDSKRKVILVVIAAITISALVYLGTKRSDISAQSESSSSKQIQIKDLNSDSGSDIKPIQSSESLIKDSYVAKVEDKCIHVEISGAVVRPGVYCLPENSLLVNLVESAQGFDLNKYASRYISQRLNLAQKVNAYQKYYTYPPKLIIHQARTILAPRRPLPKVR